MKFNLDATEEKFQKIAFAMGLPVEGLSARDAAEKMIENLFALAHDLKINMSLQDKGIAAEDLDGMVEAASKVTRLLNNNPKPMSKEDIRSIYLKLM